MSEIEEIKLVFGILLSFGGAVLLCVSMVLSKYVHMDKKCKGKTTGIVRGYSQIGSNGGVRLPKVEYQVDGKQYFVVGPQYKATVVTSIWTPNSVNDMTYYEDENHVLHVKRNLNSYIKISYNPMRDMFPVGSELPVFYNENRPKVAYVLRFCNKSSAFWLTFICGIGIFLMDVYIIFFL